MGRPRIYSPEWVAGKVTGIKSNVGGNPYNL